MQHQVKPGQFIYYCSKKVLMFVVSVNNLQQTFTGVAADRPKGIYSHRSIEHTDEFCGVVTNKMYQQAKENCENAGLPFPKNDIDMRNVILDINRIKRGHVVRLRKGSLAMLVFNVDMKRGEVKARYLSGNGGSKTRPISAFRLYEGGYTKDNMRVLNDMEKDYFRFGDIPKLRCYQTGNDIDIKVASKFIPQRDIVKIGNVAQVMNGTDGPLVITDIRGTTINGYYLDSGAYFDTHVKNIRPYNKNHLSQYYQHKLQELFKLRKVSQMCTINNGTGLIRKYFITDSFISDYTDNNKPLYAAGEVMYNVSIGKNSPILVLQDFFGTETQLIGTYLDDFSTTMSPVRKYKRLPRRLTDKEYSNYRELFNVKENIPYLNGKYLPEEPVKQDDEFFMKFSPAVTPIATASLIQSVITDVIPREEKETYMSQSQTPAVGTLFQTIETGSKKPRYGTFLTVDSQSRYVLEMKGKSGDIEPFAPDSIAEVVPYTVKLRSRNFGENHVEVTEGSVAENDILSATVGGARDMWIVVELNTKSRSTKDMTEARILQSKPLK